MFTAVANEPVFTSPQLSVELTSVLSRLAEMFEIEFALWNGEDGTRTAPAGVQHSDHDPIISAIVRTVAEQGKPQFIADEDGVVVLAAPVVVQQQRWVATAPFLTRPLRRGEDIPGVARLLDCGLDAAGDWLRSRSVWEPELLLRLATALTGQFAAEETVRQQSREIEAISANLASTYEEISLIYSVTQNLRLSRSDDELGQMAVEWLRECLPVEAAAVLYLPLAAADEEPLKVRSEPLLIAAGDCPLSEGDLLQLVRTSGCSPARCPYIANRSVTENEAWNFPGVRQVILVPLAEGDNVFGWLAAFNHVDDKDFGSVEANLLHSLGTLLGIHSGNRELYRQQSELVANIVRALVSAVDAKDPYTSGHSDRVARFAVRIALELRCNPKFLNTIYMAGLLHDIGKIGIDDNVLRKAGRLTELEFEHIKKHPEMGHHILADLKQLADVLPAVLHHHEQWDGKGYPHGLERDGIPLIARIMAVADSYDAMTSDRPYRSGMPVEKVNDIFRRGSGVYWDPAIVDAYFKVKDDIADIANRERPAIDYLQGQWI